MNVDARGQRLDRDGLDPRQQPGEEVAGRRFDRRQREAAVAGHHGRDAVQARRRQRLVPEDLRVVVACRSTNPGATVSAVRRRSSARRSVVDPVDRDDPAVADADVGSPGRSTGSVDDAAVHHHDVELHDHDCGRWPPAGKTAACWVVSARGRVIAAGNGGRPDARTRRSDARASGKAPVGHPGHQLCDHVRDRRGDRRGGVGQGTGAAHGVRDGRARERAGSVAQPPADRHRAGREAATHFHEGTQLATIRAGVLTYHVVSGTVLATRVGADVRPRGSAGCRVAAEGRHDRRERVARALRRQPREEAGDHRARGIAPRWAPLSTPVGEGGAGRHGSTSRPRSRRRHGRCTRPAPTTGSRTDGTGSTAPRPSTVSRSAWSCSAASTTRPAAVRSRVS